MSTETPLSDSARGYLSPESKRRFTIVAGVLGAVFFVAQIALPMIIMFAIMLPTMMSQAVRTTELRQATLWQGEIWYVENAVTMNWRDLEHQTAVPWLKHLGLADLREAKDTVRLQPPEQETAAKAGTPELLAQGDRLWVIGTETVSYYEPGSLTRLGALPKPARASRSFLYQGQPALLTRGRSPRLVTLHVDGATAEWRAQPFALDPPDGSSLSELQVVNAGGRDHLIAEACGEEGEGCALFSRELTGGAWWLLTGEAGCCPSWRGVALGDEPAIVIVEQTDKGPGRFAVVTPGTGERRELPAAAGRFGWNWQAFSSGKTLLLLSEGMPGSRTLVEVADGRAVRTVDTKGSFPFGEGMMAMMTVPQLLPLVLSLALAFVLTVEMRKHRVGTYVANGVERRFATLWRRAWAQVVDAVFLGAGFVAPFAWMGMMFSDPERMIESQGRFFPFAFFGLLALAFVWMLLVLAVFSYFEGRFGKTPGKWLLRIRVLGTDLRPCGFWRALVRNLLTFVDGFFNFLVGVLLVALTEHWQRLGDLAARTIVVVDGPARPLGGDALAADWASRTEGDSHA